MLWRSSLKVILVIIIRFYKVLFGIAHSSSQKSQTTQKCCNSNNHPFGILLQSLLHSHVLIYIQKPLLLWEKCTFVKNFPLTISSLCLKNKTKQQKTERDLFHVLEINVILWKKQKVTRNKLTVIVSLTIKSTRWRKLK